jgi:hypothetical protein
MGKREGVLMIGSIRFIGEILANIRRIHNIGLCLRNSNMMFS